MKRITYYLLVIVLFLSAFTSLKLEPQLPTDDPYSDEFNSTILNQSWMWINEDPTRWSLSASPGNMRIMVAKGDMVSYCGTTAKNVLLKVSPSGNYEIVTKVNVNASENYHLAGLMAFNSVTNYVKVGIAYNGPELGGLSAITTLVKNNQLSKRLWISIPTSTPAYLRLVKVENQISGFYGQDGNNWQFIGSINQTDFSYTQFGLYAFSSCFGNPTEIPADFDYFRVEETVIPPTPTPSPQSPIILLPGIMGSKLQNTPIISLQCLGRPSGEVWPNIVGLGDIYHYNQALSTLWLNSDGRTPENSCDIISPSSIVGKVIDDYYDHFMSVLENEHGYEVTPFPYDWRLDINDIVLDLNAFISTNYPNEKVVLVGHSMGGWVARQFIANPTRAEKVARVISVGTPYWGAPKIALHMRSGTAPVGFLNVLVNNDVLWELIKDSTGAMQILPAEGYFEQFDTIGGLIGYYINGDTSLGTYEQTTQFFVDGNPALAQNSNLITKGRDFHRAIDHFPDDLSVPYHILAANHIQTIRAIREYPCRFGFRYVCVRPLYYTLGDGTAPFDSARLWGAAGDWSGGADVCTYNRSSISKEHSQMLADDNVIADILRIIKGEKPLNCLLNYGSPALSERADSGEILQEDLSYLEIVAWGNHRVKIQDGSGNVAGYNEDGLIENQIPFSTYDLTSDGTIVVVPTDNTYQLSIELMSDSPFSLEISELVSVTLSNISPFQKAMFFDIDHAVGGIVTMQIASPVELTALELDHDIDNDGKVDQSSPPTLLLNQDQINDFTFPTTTIAVQGDKNSLGFYEGLVKVTLSAVDDGAGVFRTEYSTDGGKTWNLYTQLLDVYAEQVPVFYARSFDLAGNEEFPWPNTRLLAYTVYLPYAGR